MLSQHSVVVVVVGGGQKGKTVLKNLTVKQDYK